MSAHGWVRLGLGVVLAAAVTVGGYAIYAQNARIDELAASVAVLSQSLDVVEADHVSRDPDPALVLLLAELGMTDPGSGSSRLAAVEDQLGMDDPLAPATALADRVTAIEDQLDGGPLAPRYDIGSRIGFLESDLAQLRADLRSVCSSLNFAGLLVPC